MQDPNVKELLIYNHMERQKGHRFGVFDGCPTGDASQRNLSFWDWKQI